MRGPKPKPTNLKLVTGNPGKRKLNKREPQPTAGVPTCPSFLSKEAKEEWKRVVPELEKAGLICELYRSPLAAYCQLWGRFVEAEKLGVPLTAATVHQMRSLGAEFGLTPSSRPRLVTGLTAGHEPNDPFEDYLRGR